MLACLLKKGWGWGGGGGGLLLGVFWEGGGGGSVFLLRVCMYACEERDLCSTLFPFSSVNVLKKGKYGGKCGCMYSSPFVC